MFLEIKLGNNPLKVEYSAFLVFAWKKEKGQDLFTWMDKNFIGKDENSDNTPLELSSILELVLFAHKVYCDLNNETYNEKEILANLPVEALLQEEAMGEIAKFMEKVAGTPGGSSKSPSTKTSQK